MKKVSQEMYKANVYRFSLHLYCTVTVYSIGRTVMFMRSDISN